MTRYDSEADEQRKIMEQMDDDCKEEQEKSEMIAKKNKVERKR